MTADIKDKIQYGCAVTSFLSGIVLCYINYFQTGDIANGVLGFLGMTMSFTGGIFGITLYVRTKVAEVTSYIDEKIKEKKE